MGHWKGLAILLVLLWQHSEVTCQCNEGDLRIQGGSSANTGRVEICHDNIWGTVCDDSWGTNDARVVCRQLNYNTGTVRAIYSGFTNGAGTIWLDNVNCVGTENRLVDCPARPWGDDNCNHAEDAGVTCTANTCNQGSLRLVGGTVSQGRVEVCNNNIWGTVCDDFFGSVDARVACRQLGFTDTGAVALYSGFPNGNGRIWLDNLYCRGTENRLIDCPRQAGVGTHNCNHNEDSGVRCPTCTQSSIRLRGTNSRTFGRVEICNNNVWGTVCDHNFAAVDAQVVCRQLGFTPDGASFSLGGFSNGATTQQIWLDEVQCSGTENRLIDCPASPLGTTNCQHVDDVGVRCVSCTNGAVRLQDGASTNEGRVEVCRTNAWGTICEDGWGDEDAQVICRQLNLPSEGAVALSANSVIDGVGSVWLTNVMCVGTESTLLSCPGVTLDAVTSCVHPEDIGVRCIASTICNQGDIRIEGGSTNRGRVEFCNLNTWGTVCDDLWGSDDALVTCRQLGFQGGFAIFTGFGNGANNQRIWLDNVQCDGTEQRLDQCVANPIGVHNCNHVEDAGVVCTTSVCDDGHVRLAAQVISGTTVAGRVEVCYQNVWGTICDDGWGALDSAVVCRQLGYADTGSAALLNGVGYTRAGGGQIWLDDVACYGNEARLLNCPARRFAERSGNCDHSEDAGARCRTDTCSTGQIRLVGTTNKGRVEVCRSGAWGTMCQSGWGEANAIVACRQLGFETSGSEVIPGNMIPAGSGIINTASCRGTETRLIDCPRVTSDTSSCTHSNDVGVFCAALTCTQGSVRIVGTNGYSGRLEACNDNQWGTVCDDLFGVPDATVACRQLGFNPEGSRVLSNTATSDGRGKIWFDNLQCTGNETSLFTCPGQSLGNHNCRHSEDVGVICNRGCTQGDIRLQDGSNPTRGRVEICNNNVWGTVCDDLWGAPDARVVCRQLGYPTVGAQVLTGQNVVDGASGSRIWLDNVRCTGAEARLVDCPRNAFGSHNCNHGEDAGVDCQEGTQPFVCAQDDVRLVGGSNERVGRLEVCNDNEWGTVCSRFWGTTDARVACKQLGYPADGAQALYANSNQYPAGSGTIWLDEVRCTGRESYLFSCSYRLVSFASCSHNSDIGVRCQAGCTEHAVRVVGGREIFEGRVEICLDNKWGTVCNTTWTNTEATVICNQLGFSSLGSSVIYTGYGLAAEDEKIAIDRVSCQGTEDGLATCSYSSTPGASCSHDNDAAIRCTNLLETCTQNDLRLAGGNSTFGRVEICNNNVWGTICDDWWGTPDAMVACRQLGFSADGARAQYGGFTNGVGEIWLDTVRCTGTESSLALCRHDGFGNNNCGHLEDAGVSCPPPIICIEGDVRLVGLNNPLRGRVEFCHNNEWGTVCDDNFWMIDARVVCRQLGYSPDSAYRVYPNQIPDGNGTIWLDNVACIGTEARLQDCRANPIGVHNCGHNEDVGVVCSPNCDDGDVRLVDGDNSTIGRVEFCFGNVWGTVCDDFWSDIDARVACSQLGFSSDNARAVRLGNGYMVGNGTDIWLDNVQCVGTESRLIECPSNQIGTHNCQHFEDAGVMCMPGCSNTSIRLQGSSSSNLGRVEICLNNQWGTVCENNWGNVDATVVCRQLGFSTIGATALYSGFTNAAFDARIWLNAVQCTGRESRLFDCRNASVPGSCNHNRDAGVTCQQLCIQGDIRLQGGSARSGRVEVCNNGIWGTVCDDVWGARDAQVACRQLSYASTGAVATRTGFTNAGASVPIWLDNVNCIGTETKLINCQGNGLGQHNCGHVEDAGVTCQAGCVTGDVRIRGGTALSGRVEICNNNVWGTVCDDLWGRLDATVVCRQLGYSDVGTIARYGGFPNGAGQIWLDNVRCTGDENRLIDCMANPLGTHNCVHNEDAGVTCLPPIVCTQGDIRLQGGNATCGRVEVCNNNEWGTVCDDLWGVSDANVACRQLGYASSGAQALTTGFPNAQGDVAIWLDGLGCRGSESSLFACAKNAVGIHDCDHGEDAGVCCRDGCDFGAVRLLGGMSNRDGRVEICYNNVWGTVCDDAWSNADAQVVCRQLGLSTNGAVSITSGFQVGSGRIWLDQVQCNGRESLLIACPALPIGNQNCMGDHSEDAGVRCQAGCPHLSIRLAGTTADALSGRVELCYFNNWGTVCDDAWGNLDAQVVCRELGLRTTGARATFGNFVNGVGAIWLDDVGCRGTELTLASCPHRPYGQHNCGHSEDAGVVCLPALCAEGDLRIQGGLFVGQGRIEICHENVWGTICDDFWSTVDAAVACRQLGFPGGGVLARTGGFANGNGQIWLDNVACTGRENRLTDCNANVFGVHNCNHAEDAGVLCPSEPCREGSLRLADDPQGRNNTGRLEYCHNNLWGTICGNGFDVNDARVACYQLGFNRTGAAVLPAGQVRDANGRQIWFDNPRCTGNELTLAACPKNSWGRFAGSCNFHQGDIGVTCQAFRPICTQGDLRLQDGTNNHTGRLEVCNLNQWGTVCDDFFYLVDARVACTQLGFSDADATPLTGSQVTAAANSVPIWLDNVRCSGTENRLIDCNHNALGVHNCAHSEDAGVACVDSVCVQSSVRLQGGANQYTGRVEICFNNQWGTICDSQWSAADVRVLCRQLGYSPNGAVALTSGFTNAGSGVPVFYDNVRCGGGERRLIECPRSGGTCGHSNDAGVRCQGGCTTGDVRITGSNSFRFGRIEICYNNIWGQVCENQWDDNDAAVACRQLGFSATGAAAIFSGFQNSVGTVHLDNVRCTGSEQTLMDCPANPIGMTDCTDVENAGVRCELGCTDGNIRLADGNTNLNGRVEICYNNTWGTICDDLWGTADANVVCRQLGFRPTGARALRSGFTDGTGPIWLSELRCFGLENNITECNSTAYGVHHCDHREDIFVQCQPAQAIPVCATGQIRLRGGSTVRGRVEICNDNQWGTVCDDFWDNNDARVACRQLGHSATGATALRLGAVPDGTGQIWLDNVRCVGTESRLIDCPANNVGLHNCVHSEDAGVNCVASTTCTNGDLRIVGSALAGRLEMCYTNVWGTVCSDGYSSQEAAVACRQLGFSDSGAIPLYQRLTTNDPFSAGTGRIWLDNLNCNASERRLIECPRGRPIGNPNNCNHAKDVGVRCEPIGFRDVCTTGQVRLNGGNNPREGRVEVCYYNQWGTVCDDAFGFNEAKVICKQLGFTNTTATAFGSARFGRGAGPIVMDNVACTGNENSLMDCPSTFNHNCNHGEDAGVRCYTVTNSYCETGMVRLNYNINRNRATGGRVEVCNDHQWGTVCDDDWGFKDSLVVCRQLGWRGISGTAGGGAWYGRGTGNIWLDQVRCQGYEESIFGCPANPLGRDDCTHAEDAGVNCGQGCADGDIRLSNGRNATQGRVEVCYGNNWGTVCDDFWGTLDAQVVCRQLGFGGLAPISAHSRAAFGQGSGTILLDNVQCVGSESRLLDCRANPITTHNCAHSEDAGVTCNMGCEHGALRLVGGTVASEGRVEICNDGGWGTVCDDFWGNADAQVVCRQLGFTPENALAISFAAFGQGTGPITLDNVFCTGRELRLLDCPANALTVHNCAHSEDASVRCSTPCTQGAIRLAGGTSALEGRVEVCNNNQWGTVCDDAWGTPDATVVCRQLGYSTTGAMAFARAAFGRGVGSIVLDQVGCAGTEARLFLCPSNPIGVHDCSHFEDAGVRCQNGTTVCNQGDLRLRGGRNEFEGRVEVCNSNAWGTVCDDLWGAVDAGVACRQLGYSFTGATALSRAAFGQGTGNIWLDNVQCTGNEITLISCQSNGLGSHNCAHSEDAGVRCLRATNTCNTGDLRLVNGTTPNEGRIEVCRSNVWGTVCDDFWSSFDATVACRQLGFSITGATALARAPFGQGTGPILLDNLFCTATQLYLINCTHNGLGTHNCVHAEDAGLRCPNNNTITCTNGDIRLVGGSNNFQGRVEICWNNNWGTICDDFWGNLDAQVVCRQLGYRTAGAVAISRAGFGQGSFRSAIVLDNVGCLGTEARLIQCSNGGIGVHNCAHSEDAGVTCPSSLTPACANGDIRLVGGANIREGRVEFCNNGIWGTVCDDAWDTLDANVVCRQLGFSPFGNAAVIRAFFGQGSGLIWLDNVNCAGSEARLADCPANPIGSHNCIHSEDAGVRCQALGSVTPACTTGDVRLAGSGSTIQGRVEFCSAGVWGTVCDDLWGTADANVVCRQLGFSGTGSIALSFAAFGQGTGPILLDNVGCTGTERRLADCPANPVGSHNCVHFEDASVSCSEVVTATPAPVCLQNHIRLNGGTNALNGRVEVCNNNAWGTVCNAGFGTAEANVACRQLGFSGSGAAVANSVGQGTGAIVLANLRCVGNETSLFFCPGAVLGSNTCTHTQDVGVTCRFVCVNGDIRLVGGTNDREGRVEICDSQIWGTVCDDFWSSFDAGVACTQLGYARTGAVALPRAPFGQGTGPILLDNLFCRNTETRLIDCPHNGVGVHNCVHSEDAGLRCAAGCQRGSVRLVSGTSTLEGRVEICINNAWGTVCDDSWDNNDAAVVCRQLGYSTIGAIGRQRAFYGQGTGTIQLDDVRCTGSETRLIDCPASAIGTHNCVHSEDAGVTCRPETTPPDAPCSDWDLRLVGGRTQREGRVEVCRNATWGTVCDDFWNNPDAAVVCAQLGYARAGALALSFAAFGQGTGAIYLDNVMCTGTELNIRNCSLLTTHNCVHSEDASVICTVCDENAVRLVGSTNAYEGRVEVCINQVWGTVCDDAWGTVDATVVCRQAGFSRFGAASFNLARFGQGTGPILLDNVNCIGNETRLVDCANNGVGIHNCAHFEDASVRCNQTLVCNHGALRLRGGPSAGRGRLEICANETWGTICDDSWGDVDANVACRILGYSRFNASAVGNALYGQGGGPIILTNVACTGSEINLLSCGFSTATTGCSHAEDASIQCSTTLACTDGDIRLVGGRTQYEGRVEVCSGEGWGTVCDDFWNAPDANVVCRQLGFNDTGATALLFAVFGQGTGPILVDDVRCVGTEATLLSCPHITQHNCIHLEDASVRCLPPYVPCSSGDVRLVGGTTSAEGRVEFCQTGNWGTVCDDAWGIQDAQVVCRQLGYTTRNAAAFSRAVFGRGTGPIYLDQVQCTGREARLADCPANPIAVHDCSHAEDAGVYCQVCEHGDVRLVNGRVSYEGRVEVCVNNTWGTVCDDFWNAPDAQVVCRQAGFQATGATALSFMPFGQGIDPILLDDVRCIGNELNILDCPYTASHNCIHLEDAGVRCIPFPCQNGAVRLSDGADNSTGRLEVCRNNQWGTVCSSGFDRLESSVVCRQLGFSRIGSVYGVVGSIPQGTGTILYTNLNCTGVEAGIANCSTGASTTTCTHAMDVVVTCRSELYCQDTSIRLANGRDQYEGRVEICYNETWGTICDGFWSTNDAVVVCRELGFATNGAVRYLNAFFGAGTGPIYLDDFLCTGRESRLVNCRNGGLNRIDFCRGHLDDAGVRCAENCTHGELRLAGGQSSNEGRVELCFSGVWGTVCDDFFGSPDAQVVCAQLGYSRTGAQAFSFAFFGQGSGPIHIDDVGCRGNELTLLSCPYNPRDNCIHLEDAGVRCQGCANGDVRLVGGTSLYEGRVEVCMGSIWGTVCDDLWDNSEATVVCRQLGFSTFGAVARSQAFFGAGTGQILLDNVQCGGSEGRLIDCTYITMHNCNHGEDAGVTCASEPRCNEGDVRLAQGTTRFNGRVELCLNETWGTVCQDGFQANEAKSVCRQLGFSVLSPTIQVGPAFTYPYAAASVPIYLDNVDCVGTESRLQGCHYDMEVSDCTHLTDVGIDCIGYASCATGDIRLVNGTNEREGRVEICVDEVWGTVCDQAWSTFDATVACRQLGFNPVMARPEYDAYFGRGTGPIWLDDLFCNSFENRLIDCRHGGVGMTDFCNGHNDDAGLFCLEGCVAGQVRLIGGDGPFEGRVEYCSNQLWGTVCHDNWGEEDAMVVCRQLGYSVVNATAYSDAFFGPGTGTILLDNVACVGTEANLTSCSATTNTADCVHAEDASVICSQDLFCEDGDLRLVNGVVPYEGRLEICLNEVWGTICDSNWGIPQATVACSSLGLSVNGAAGLRSARYGQGTGPISVDNVLCQGTEDSLLDCTYSTMTASCTHASDAGIRCGSTAPICQNWDLRIANTNPSMNNTGRLEICIRENWSSICSIGWEQADANVACRQLGYSRFGAGSGTVAATGATYQFNFACTGNETTLRDCARSVAVGCSGGQITCNALVCNDEDLRLLDGPTTNEGRVEICYGEVWGTICQNSWSTTDANVACLQLGFHGVGASIYPISRYQQGTGPIYLNNLICTGNELRLADCDSDGFGVIGSCTHADDAAMFCLTPCTNGDIRLRDGNNPYEGRVEVCLRGVWGSVCDDLWSGFDARVACRQLGFSEFNAEAIPTSRFGVGTGPIHLDDLRCNGFENRLVDCSYDSNTADCVHFEDAALRCRPCDDGEIRLEGGTSLYNGRVEVCWTQQWFGVCNTYWSAVDATVACRHLGYSGFRAIAYTDGRFGEGVSQILLDQVNCTGSELSLLACQNIQQIGLACPQTSSAGIQCNSQPVCVENSTRLVGGRNDLEGRVEVCVLETWRTICNMSWSPEDAGVVCSQLGFSRYNATVINNSTVMFGQGNGPIHATNVRCHGEESRLLDCPLDTTTTACSHTNDAGIRCTRDLLCQNADIRLVNGTVPWVGRVEFCWNEVWGTICDQFWSTFDANVACRQLGYAPIGIPRYNAFYGQGTGPLQLDDLICRNTESRLVDCAHGGVGMTDNCRGHLDDAGLDCRESCTSGSVRLVGGNDEYSGRLEVCKSQNWGTVCDDIWDNLDATVACRQLGYSALNSTALVGGQVPEGAGSIHFDNVMCTGDEDSLFDCPLDDTPNCNHREDAGVRCMPFRICDDGDIRLVGGTNPMEGRVEVCQDELWGTVCDSLWSASEGRVTCRQLGFSQFGSVLRTSSFYGPGLGPITTGALQCAGSESRLVDCPSGDISTCTHAHDAGIVCQTKICTDGDVRVVGGSNPREGRAEVCYNEQFGTICDLGFGIEEARVICGSLGFSRIRATGIPGGIFPEGQNSIWLNNLNCTGLEDSLLDCPTPSTTGVNGCLHAQDAGVICDPRISYPQNVTANSPTNTTIVVAWTAPLEFYSNITKYTVNCTDGQSTREVETSGPNEYTITIPGLSPYTQYLCCSTARYSTPTEDAGACANVVTRQGVPGRPANLTAVVTDPRQCSQVRLGWDQPPPSERNGVITGYTFNAMSRDAQTPFMQNMFTPNNYYMLTGLSCCTPYQYSVSASTVVGQGISSVAYAFRTPAANLRDVTVGVNINSRTSLTVNWNIPVNVSSQGLDTVAVSASPVCVNGVVLQGQQFTTSDENAQSTTFSSLMPAVPYRVVVSVSVCQTLSQVYTMTHYTERQTLLPPKINSVSRTSISNAQLTFSASPSAVEFDYYSIRLYIATGRNNMQQDLMAGSVTNLTGTPGTLTIDTLTPCNTYWVQVLGVTCGGLATSEALYIPVLKNSTYQATMSLANGQTCATWVTASRQAQVSTRIVNNVLRGAVCNLPDVTCVVNTTLSCGKETGEVMISVLLASTDVTSSDQQLDCLYQWGQNSPGIFIDNIQYTIKSIQTASPTTAKPTQAATEGASGGGANLGYVYAIVAIAVVGLIIGALLVIIVVLVIRRRDKPAPRKFDERMLDDQDDSHSTHSIGIVENPLYAEQEEYNSPSYASLKKKEADEDFGYDEDEVGFEEKDVHFDPPNDDY